MAKITGRPSISASVTIELTGPGLSGRASARRSEAPSAFVNTMSLNATLQMSLNDIPSLQLTFAR